jgi:replicative DNA helicase
MAAILDRTLPHSLEAERFVLGALMVSQKLWHAVAAEVSAQDFFRDAHRKVFDSLARLIEKGKVIDLVTVKNDLGVRGLLDEVGGPAYIASFVDGMPASSNAVEYARIVKDNSRLRDLIHISNKLMAAAYDREDQAPQLADAALRALQGISGAGAVDAPVLLKDAVKSYCDTLSAGELPPPTPTGYVDLDSLIGGIHPETLVIVAARPSVGKSSFALGVSDQIARSGVPVGFFSLEMRQEDLSAQIIAWESDVPVQTVARGLADDVELAEISAAWMRIDQIAAPLYMLASDASLSRLWTWARRLKEDCGVRVIVVDYMQLLMPDQRHASQEQEVAALSRGLKKLARDLKVTVVALSQLSRAPESRNDKRPHLSDLRSSGCLEQDCDLALLLFRQEMYKRSDENEGTGEVIVAKNRTGPVGTVRLCFDARFARFRNLAKGDF